VTLPRLRQAVLAAADLDKTCELLEDELGISEPFHDKGIIHFGLRNAVYPIGDTFLEVVSPVQEGTAAGRQIERAGGDCGYMCMFELSDADAVRSRINAAGVRIVWETTHDDIVDLHLHPKDVPGAIVALDITDPPGSWRWAGPRWEGAAFAAAPPTSAGGGMRGLTVAVADPAAAAARWAHLVGIAAQDVTLNLDGGEQSVTFVPAAGAAERIVEIAVATPGRTGDVTIAGVRFRRTSK
jgi:hypothetical protein